MSLSPSAIGLDSIGSNFNPVSPGPAAKRARRTGPSPVPMAALGGSLGADPLATSSANISAVALQAAQHVAAYFDPTLDMQAGASGSSSLAMRLPLPLPVSVAASKPLLHAHSHGLSSTVSAAEEAFAAGFKAPAVRAGGCFTGFEESAGAGDDLLSPAAAFAGGKAGSVIGH